MIFFRFYDCTLILLINGQQDKQIQNISIHTQEIRGFAEVFKALLSS